MLAYKMVIYSSADDGEIHYALMQSCANDKRGLIEVGGSRSSRYLGE
jgi:hypothetical protein